MLIVYFLVTNIKTQAPLYVSVTRLKSVNQHMSSESLVDDKNQSPLKQDDLTMRSCAALEQANKVDSENKAGFISTKAIQWYFDGFDKYKIAEALAATFNYSLAM